jgi:hypothetical protein
MVRSNCYLPHRTAFAKALTPITSYRPSSYSANTDAYLADFDSSGFDRK